MWAYARTQSAKDKMRECYNDIINNNEDTHAGRSSEYAEVLKERFSEQKMYAQFVSCLGVEEEIEAMKSEVEDLLSDLL